MTFVFFCKKNNHGSLCDLYNTHMHQSKEEGKDQESIQSSTTPDPRHHKGKCQNTMNITYIEPRGQRVSQQVTTRGARNTDMAVYKRQTQMTKRPIKESLPWVVSKKITGGLKVVSQYQFQP